MRHLWPNGTAEIPRVTSEWGLRLHPIYNDYRLHAGIDLVGFQYNRASAAGVVTLARYNGGAGNHVVILHDDGTVTEYKHNKDLWVTVGQRVLAGTVLGQMGTTGDSTGVHLHFETRDQQGAPTRDPRAFIAARSTDTAGSGTTPFPTTAPKGRKRMTQVLITTLPSSLPPATRAILAAYPGGATAPLKAGQGLIALVGDSPGTPANVQLTQMDKRGNEWAADHTGSLPSQYGIEQRARRYEFSEFMTLLAAYAPKP